MKEGKTSEECKRREERQGRRYQVTEREGKVREEKRRKMSDYKRRV